MNQNALSQCPLKLLKQRAFLLTKIREFFLSKNVLEVETPILSSAGNTDIHIDSFVTQSINQQHSKSYLRTSPEFPLKRLLCSGIGDIYELGKVFRKGEISTTHNVEFTLLEWYRINFNYIHLIQEVIEFFDSVFSAFNIENVQSETKSYFKVFEQYLNLDISTITIDELNLECRKHDYSGSILTQDEALDYLFATQIQHQFNRDSLTFVTLYPASQAALSQINPNDRATSLRFEVFYKGYELGNGYQELTEAQELKDRFDKDNQIRKNNNHDQLQVDENLLMAMQSGMPNCSGIAVGVDRLLMSLLDSQQLSEVLTFNAGNA